MKKSTLPVIILSFGVLTTLPAAAKVIYEPYTITTLAGWGSNEHTVDGPRHLAEFASPGGVAVDKEGNVFVAEFWGCTIRKITPKGVASTFAGKAGEPGHVDGQGGDARFDWPRGVALAVDGTLYVTEEYGNTIRKVDRQGLVTTLAFGFGGAFGLVVAPSGDVFVADAGDFSVKKITPQGDVTTFAGETFGFKDGTGTEAEFDSPVDITVDQLGNLYVADSFNNAIRKITPDAVVTTLATGITFPNGLTLDKDGYIFVSEGYFIDKVSPTGEVTEFAGGTWGE